MIADTDYVVETPILLTVPPRLGLLPDPEEWLTRDVKDRAEVISQWFVSFFFWSRWAGREPELEEYEVLARANEDARLQALLATGSLQSDVEDAVVLQLYEAARHGWYPHAELSPQEVIEQALAKSIEKDPSGGYRYEVQNVLRMVQMLEQAGVPKEQIIPIPNNMSKARAAGSEVVRLMQTDDPHKLDKVGEILQDIADPSISVRTFKERARERLSGAKPFRPAPAQAWFCIVPDGEMLIIRGTKGNIDAAVRVLDGIITAPELSDPAYLAKELVSMMTPKSSGMRTYKLDGSQFVEAPGGIRMPSATTMEIQVQNLAATHDYMIRNALKTMGYASVPVLALSDVIPDDEKLTQAVQDWCLKAFGADLGYIRAAMQNMYKVPPILYDLYPDTEIALGFGYDPILRKLALVLNIYKSEA